MSCTISTSAADGREIFRYWMTRPERVHFRRASFLFQPDSALGKFVGVLVTETDALHAGLGLGEAQDIILSAWAVHGPLSVFPMPMGESRAAVVSRALGAFRACGLKDKPGAMRIGGSHHALVSVDKGKTASVDRVRSASKALQQEFIQPYLNKKRASGYLEEPEMPSVYSVPLKYQREALASVKIFGAHMNCWTSTIAGSDFEAKSGKAASKPATPGNPGFGDFVPEAMDEELQIENDPLTLAALECMKASKPTIMEMDFSGVEKKLVALLLSRGFSKEEVEAMHSGYGSVIKAMKMEDVLKPPAPSAPPPTARPLGLRIRPMFPE